MSGGHFNYDQYRIRTIAETIRSIIDNNTKKDQWGYASNYNEETLKYFERAIEILKIAEVYTQRIDWLVSGDDGEETFMKRLHKELAEIKAIPIEPLVMQKTADIDFLVSRTMKAGTCNFTDERDTGSSSNSIVAIAYGMQKLKDQILPGDMSDLNACRNMWKKLPEHRKTAEAIKAMENAENFRENR